MVEDEEAARLAILRDFQLMDTPPEPQFDAIVRAAATHADTPMAMITLIDGERQFFKARLGIAIDGGPVEESICAVAMRSDDLFVVPDVSRDARFRDFPAVRVPNGMRFYAGVPLRLDSGERLGTLCVVDVEPRAALTAEERRALESLARRTVSAFELRRAMLAREDDSAPHRIDAVETWRDEATVLLDRAAVLLERAGASAPLAELDHVIAMLDAERAVE